MTIVQQVSQSGTGKQVRARLRAWGGDLRPGQQVRVLYLPGEPAEVVLDRF